MADIEKVIKGLEILMNGCAYIDCGDCCFYISTKPTRCGLKEEQIQEDALALLKEREAVKPITEHHLFLCPVCKNTLFREQKFCHECGKHILWEVGEVNG